MTLGLPRVTIAALKGSAGKTLISIGVLRSLEEKGYHVFPFKKGPDYIDAGWLALSAGRPCGNLDTYMMGEKVVRWSVFGRTAGCDGVLIEGNRGLFDGVDSDGTHSTAHLARLLKSPVILIVDCSKVTRTAAALVLGCMRFEEDLCIKAVILNRVANPRHEIVVRNSIEKNCGLPVIGAVPRLGGQLVPERHLGLVPMKEFNGALRILEAARQVAERYIDVDKLWSIAEDAPPIDFSLVIPLDDENRGYEDHVRPKIGVILDEAFNFYYNENIEMLKKAGAEVVFFSALHDEEVPDVDGLYIGGGFPETNASRLAENVSMRRSLKSAVESGMPLYAECGGLIYLGEELVTRQGSFPMAGFFPFSFIMGDRPHGHGYTCARVASKNPFFDVGQEIKGHEFHYSRPVKSGEAKSLAFAFQMLRGRGIFDGKDGVLKKRALASFCHFHALSCPRWARSFVEVSKTYKIARSHRIERIGFQNIKIL